MLEYTDKSFELLACEIGALMGYSRERVILLVLRRSVRRTMVPHYYDVRGSTHKRVFPYRVFAESDSDLCSNIFIAELSFVLELIMCGTCLTHETYVVLLKHIKVICRRCPRFPFNRYVVRLRGAKRSIPEGRVYILEASLFR